MLRPCLLLLLLPAWLTSAAPATAAASAAPVVRFSWDSEASARLARDLGAVWNAEGPGLARELLPPGSRADTVACLVVGTAEFTRLFARAVPDWGVGLALPGGRAVAIDRERLPAVGRTAREVFLHEMIHALLFQAAGDTWLPGWFHEGVAMEVSGEWRFVDTVSLALAGRVPELGRLQGRFPSAAATAEQAYRISLLAVRRLQQRHGPDAVARVVAAVAARGDFAAGFAAATGEEPEDFAREFDAHLRLRFGWLVMLTRWPALFVLLALVLAGGGARKIVLARRRLAAMDDGGPVPPN